MAFVVMSMDVPDVPKLTRWQKLDGLSDILIAVYAVMVHLHALPLVTGIFLAYYIAGTAINLYRGCQRFIAL
jgi:hypothetical protein